jgi:hypothetical protein
MSRQRASRVGVLVTRSTEDQGFPAACGHLADPGRFVPTYVRGEVFECSNMMYLDVAGGTTQLTGVRQQAFFEF